MANSTWGAPLAGEAMWGEAPSTAPPAVPENPAPAYLTLQINIGESPYTSLPRSIIAQ